MKYTVEGFSQEELLRLGLDAVDAVILRWFVDFLPFMKKFRHGDPVEYEYGWVAYSYLIQELPIVHIENKDVVGRRFKKYREANLMAVVYDAESRTYFRIVPETWARLVGSDSKVGQFFFQ